MTLTSSRLHRNRHAFSLIELLTVMAVVLLLMSFAGPAVTSITSGSSLSRAGQTISDIISWARQEAAVRNRETQVRFFKFDDGISGSAWRGAQVWIRLDDGSFAPVTRFQTIPSPIVISEDAMLSPLIQSSPSVTGQESIPGKGSAPLDYAGFRFRPSGAPEQTVTSTNNYVTLVDSRAPQGSSTPENYYAIQVSPITGRVEIYRP